MDYKTDVICPECGSANIYVFGMDDYTIEYPLCIINLDCQCKDCKLNIMVSANFTLAADVIVINNDN